MQQPAPGAMTRLEPAHDDDEPIQSESADVVYSEVRPPEVLTKEGWLLVQRADQPGAPDPAGARGSAGSGWRRRPCRVRKDEEFDGTTRDDWKDTCPAWMVCAVVGIFVLEGISIEFPGIIFGGLGYYFGLRNQDRIGQILGVAAAVLNVISMVISGMSGPPQ
jgi:hypothetical protein